MKVGLFIPCYVDAVYPQVGVATYRLLTSLGLDVHYPQGQTCCGQPMGNAGFQQEAAPLADKFERLFAGCDYVVAPSVSCTAFIRYNYPGLVKEGHTCAVSKHAIDLVEFLHDVLKVKSLPSRFPYRVSIHNSCHGVRELSLSTPSENVVEPRVNKIRDLLSLVEGIEIVEPDRPDECCGFGGMFSIEETAVSGRLGMAKLQRHIDTGAKFITGADCSCLMHMAGIASREGKAIRFIHVAQILAGEESGL